MLCLLLAAVLRLAAFDEALIGADQTSILAAAANIASGRDFPGVGIKSSAGVMQTAVTGYLAALPLLLVHRIIAIKWFFSLLDLLALALPDALAPGEYRLLIGAYTWPEITRVFLESGEAAYEVRRWELPQD